MQREVHPPSMMASNFNIFEIINFKTYELLPRWESSDPDPIFAKNIFRSPKKIAWHSRYQTVFPHSLKYQALRYITTNDVQGLIKVLKDPNFMIDKPIDSKYSLTALHYAAYTNKYPIVELLLMNGANINQADEEGNTPLMLAVKKECLQSINSLMKNGCNWQAPNIYGVNPAQKAKEIGKNHIADFIENYPKTRRKFPKFRVKLNIEEKIRKQSSWQFIKNYPLYSGKAIISPFNNFKGGYSLNLSHSTKIQDHSGLLKN